MCALDDGESFRTEIYPRYKKNRSSKKESKDYYWHSVANLNYDYKCVPGLEADDICYLYAKNYLGSTVVSEDVDLCQLTLLPSTKMYFPFQRKYFEGEADRIICHKIILGDISDNIPRSAKAGLGPVNLNKIYDVAEDYENLIDLVDVSYGFDLKQLDINERLIDFNLLDYDLYFTNIENLFTYVEEEANFSQ